ncbi:MAG: 4-hydroxybenzoate octaprenyltransferase [Pseudomonadota bacterium]
MSANQPVADAPPGNFVDTWLPARLRPFARLARWDRPIGWWLLLWPCWWSCALASSAAGHLPSLWFLALFLMGAILMRGAGCTYNDILDRKIDAGVARTRSRPIPSGQVTPLAALVFAIAQGFLALAVLLQFNPTTIATAIASLGIVAVYPLAKRVTDVPQVVLGLAFAWGGLVGWTSVTDSLALPAFLVYAAAIAWTVGYDTIYAHQDKRDDAIIGVRSTARLFGTHTKLAVSICYVLTVALFTGAILTAGLGIPSFVGLAAFAAHLAYQVKSVKTDDPPSCLRAFKSNRYAGWLVFAGITADAIV